MFEVRYGRQMVGEPGDRWAERGVQSALALLEGGPWESTTIHGTGGGGYGSSVARLRSGNSSVIVKVVRRNDAAASESDSWLRELEIYRSSWLSAFLPASLAMPKCLGSAIDKEVAVLVLEDLTFDDRDARSIEWYARLARGLGELSSAPPLDVPTWASQGFVTSQARTMMAAVPGMAMAPSPHLADLVDDWLPLLERLVDAAPSLLGQLDAMPQSFNHLDAFSRNAAEIDGRIVLIDWAFAGVAPIGADAAGVVAMTAMHGDAAGLDLSQFHRSVVDAFVSGVGDLPSGVAFEDVEHAIEALLTLRWAGFLAQVHGAGDEILEIVESVSGRPFDEGLRAWQALSELVMPMAERVLHRVDR